MRKKWLSILLAVTMLIAVLLPGAASAAPREEQTIHIVQRGEMLSAIALRYGVNMWTLARVNGITNPSRIYVGQRLIIPCRQTGGRVHVVRRGENLTWIALRYGVNVWTLARVNGITNLNHIYVGQRLTIPGAPPPAPAPQPPATPPSSYPGPWTAEYFSNTHVGGVPCVTRTDSVIDFNWAYGPAADCMPIDHFSVRWTGSFYFDGGTYRFFARVDDGVRVYVDGERVIDGWRAGGWRLYTGDQALAAGYHTVQVEYYDSIQVARIKVWWDKIAGPAPIPVPYPTDGWLGHYFNNTDLTGAPVFTERVPWIGAEWETGSPDPAVRSDYFSARWTTRMHLNQDHYRFCAMSDDGARIWVDDHLVLDEWHPNNGVAYCDIFYATYGEHNVRVEYYEDGGDALIYVWWEPE